MIPPSRNLSPLTGRWLQNTFSVAHPYLDGGGVRARNEWEIAGAEKGGDQVIPKNHHCAKNLILYLWRIDLITLKKAPLNLVGKCETMVLVKGLLERLVRETWSRPERARWESGGRRESNDVCSICGLKKQIIAINFLSMTMSIFALNRISPPRLCRDERMD